MIDPLFLIDVGISFNAARASVELKELGNRQRREHARRWDALESHYAVHRDAHYFGIYYHDINDPGMAALARRRLTERK